MELLATEIIAVYISSVPIARNALDVDRGFAMATVFKLLDFIT